MNRSMHKRSTIAKLYRPKNEGTKSRTGIEESHAQIQLNNDWLRLLKIEVDKEENLTVDKMRSYEEKSNNCQEKALRGKVQTDESRRWLRNAFCKKDTECMILAVQEKAFLQILSSCTLTKYQILHCVDWAVAILKPP